MSEYETLESGKSNGGVPLLMLHGMMGQPGNWKGVIAHLPPGCRPIALRFPFFQGVVELSTIEAVSQYVLDYLAWAGIEEAVLCGNSLGGHISLDLAIRFPALVRGLVITGSSGLFEKTFGTVTPHPPREWVQGKINDIFYDPIHATPELVDEVAGIISVRRNVRDLVKIAKSAKRDNLAGRLGQIACPTLVIWGRNDIVTPPQVAEEFHRGIAGSELVWFDRCGHTAMMEHPREFGLTVSRWWKQHIDGVFTSRPGDQAATQRLKEETT